MAITGQGKTRGTAAILAFEATINQHIAYITPRNPTKVDVDYLRAFLTAAYPELRRMSDDSGSTKGALTCADIRHFRVALPPIIEQQEIVASLENATVEIDTALELARSEIALLREYRTRLIADVVTGKLDVRAAAAALPDAPPDPAPDDEEGMEEGEEESEEEAMEEMVEDEA